MPLAQRLSLVDEMTLEIDCGSLPVIKTGRSSHLNGLRSSYSCIFEGLKSGLLRTLNSARWPHSFTTMGRHRTHVKETVQGPPNSRSVLLAGAQSVLETTAARIRNEVASLDGELLEEKLLLLQQLDHLEATLSLLERVLPPAADGDIKLLAPEELCEACRHLNMAVHTMLALAPKFREATSHRLAKQLGSSTTSIFDCFSRRRPPVEMSPEKRKNRIRLQLDKLEKQHEDCLLDLLLSFEHLATADVIPPPDAPPRCAEGSRYVLSGQAKLHQSHAMEPVTPNVLPRNAYESPTMYSECSYACGNIRPSSPSCSSLPNLGALGPCDLCNSGATFTQLPTPVTGRYTCMAADGTERNGGCHSPFGSRVADYASQGSMLGSDCRRR
ncbi:hypothetical protein, conserved [Eimeria brunetti]|uniref:Uncharacterized protein n=1 Tax=Eimeria brunetti TaxID=51314 RepID=U6LLP8_9EIME|nr:hypothetical protein, conserved [Eimeria brunetti]